MRLTWIFWVAKLGMLAAILTGQTQGDPTSADYSTSAKISCLYASFHLRLVEASFRAIIREGHALFPPYALESMPKQLIPLLRLVHGRGGSSVRELLQRVRRLHVGGLEL